MPLLRLAHFSDAHVYVPGARWQARDWFGKRLTGWLNLTAGGRAKRFARAPAVLAALVRDVRERRPELLVFSGDATALAFEEEFALAARLLHVGDPSLPPALAVPGNHDYYVYQAATAGLFERHFAPWQQGNRLDGQAYPFVRTLGEYAFFCVNSSRANRLFWDASGGIGEPQLKRLRRLLAAPAYAGLRKVLVTHYPLMLADGSRERGYHGLHDAQRLAEAAQAGGIVLWLHGHRHHSYRHAATESRPFATICAGSICQTGIASYLEYEFDGDLLRGQRRAYAVEKDVFERVEEFALPWGPARTS